MTQQRKWWFPTLLQCLTWSREVPMGSIGVMTSALLGPPLVYAHILLQSLKWILPCIHSCSGATHQKLSQTYPPWQWQVFHLDVVKREVFQGNSKVWKRMSHLNNVKLCQATAGTSGNLGSKSPDSIPVLIRFTIQWLVTTSVAQTNAPIFTG